MASETASFSALLEGGSVCTDISECWHDLRLIQKTSIECWDWVQRCIDFLLLALWVGSVTLDRFLLLNEEAVKMSWICFLLLVSNCTMSNKFAILERGQNLNPLFLPTNTFSYKSCTDIGQIRLTKGSRQYIDNLTRQKFIYSNNRSPVARRSQAPCKS